MTMTSNEKRPVSELPPDAIDFAHRMYNAAREGNAELLLAAVDAGLSQNLTNEKGISSLRAICAQHSSSLLFFAHMI
jgi:hypothetical protein